MITFVCQCPVHRYYLPFIYIEEFLAFRHTVFENNIGKSIFILSGKQLTVGLKILISKYNKCFM